MRKTIKRPDFKALKKIIYGKGDFDENVKRATEEVFKDCDPEYRIEQYCSLISYARDGDSLDVVDTILTFDNISTVEYCFLVGRYLKKKNKLGARK